MILAGDHCQLPPTVKCYEAMRQGFGKSLMERIVENKPETVTLLTMQYRMHEDIMRFPNEWFYGGRMKAAPGVSSRGILSYDTPLVWVEAREDMDADASERAAVPQCREEIAGENFGRVNRGEAELALRTLLGYLERIGKERVIQERIDVGLISPYKAQVRYLRRRVRQDSSFKPFRNLISVNTVDGFQGQERDVIVISMVRSNEEGQIGFLRDLRRMNVAMTRARMKLIIIGDSSTLSRHPFYRRLHESVVNGE